MSDPVALVVLLLAGVVAGFVNTLAGGGSLLTVPALMLIGLPADVANGTNRVGVVLQTIVATGSFDRAGALDRGALLALLVPLLGGAVLGALGATHVAADVLEPVLLVTLVVMALLLALRPGLLNPATGGEPVDARRDPRAMAQLFLTGLYAGFLQAGVGFLLIAVLAGRLRYDLVRANALKVVVVGVITCAALVIFVGAGQVRWVPGLVLGAATMVGAWAGVRFAVRANPRWLRWLVLVSVTASAVALMAR